MCVSNGVSATILGSGKYHPIVLDNHPADSRLTVEESGKVQTLTSRMGTGGGNVPLVLVYGISSKDSNGMKSDNPHVGFYEAKTVKTLDTSGGNPTCNQGGMVVCESVAIQGNVIGRKDENGPAGSGVNVEKMFTLNTTDKHCVAFRGTGFADFKESTVSATHTATGGSLSWGETLITEDAYVCRRLTPTECARLQGFPDDWGKDVPFHSDSAEYKMWGNGIALPCAEFVLGNIAKKEGLTHGK